MLYIIATPIGNMKDITFRAVETLKKVDLIAVEDTRRTGLLLSHYSIKKRMISVNEKNELRKIPEILSYLKKGFKVALLSDSGTPAISDPGFKLIREVIKEGIKVESIPGPCAAINALVASGQPTDKFAFYGFLSKKVKAKSDILRRIKKNEETAIIYESPYRVRKTLEIMEKIIPEKNVCICREMTKKFEEFIRGNPGLLLKKIGDTELKGEIVIIIGKAR